MAGLPASPAQARQLQMGQALRKAQRVMRDVSMQLDNTPPPYQVFAPHRTSATTATVPYVVHLSDGRALRSALMMKLQRNPSMGWYVGWKLLIDPLKVAVGAAPNTVLPTADTPSQLGLGARRGVKLL
jgi:hypothetical protein